jgi:hypothetical protein
MPEVDAQGLRALSKGLGDQWMLRCQLAEHAD